MIIIGLSFLTYLLMYISPGDPALKKLNAQGISVSEETLETAREEMGLNEPFLARYANWLSNALTGDLGASYKDGLPVANKLMHAMRYTLILSAASLAVSLIISLPLAVITAVKKDGVLDNIVRLLSFIGNSLPNFPNDRRRKAFFGSCPIGSMKKTISTPFSLRDWAIMAAR